MNNEIIRQPQEFTIASWSAWNDKQTGQPVRDNHGNVKGSVTFNEFKSEPVDATFKQPPNIGDKKYGQIESYKSRSGSLRLKYKAVSRPQQNDYQGTQNSQQGDMRITSSPAKDGKNDHAIAKSVALKAAVDYYAPTDVKDRNPNDVLTVADKFVAWLEDNPAPAEKPSYAPDPMDRVFGSGQYEQYEGDPQSIPFMY